MYPTYLKCTALVFMLPPMQFLMFTTAIKGFMAAGAALVCLNMAEGTDELIRLDVTHDLQDLEIDFCSDDPLKIHFECCELLARTTEAIRKPLYARYRRRRRAIVCSAIH